MKKNILQALCKSIERILKMSAWNHTSEWNEEYYQTYRRYVTANAPAMKGREEDCADLSMLLIVNFAAEKGLPLTFADNQDIYYSSNRDCQFPPNGMHIHYGRVGIPTHMTINPSSQFSAPSFAYSNFEFPDGIIYSNKNYTWKNKEEYYFAIRQRINANALYSKNTVKNYFGPQAGDLLLSNSHAGLVINTYHPGVPHPRASDENIKPFDKAAAEKEVHVLEYFRDNHGMLNNENKTKYHFDYLNHRGKKKPKAELIYFRRAEDAVTDGFEFRQYSNTVLQIK